MTNLEKFLKMSKQVRDSASHIPWRIHAMSEYILENKDQTIGMLGGMKNLVNNGEFITRSCNNSARLEEMVRVMAEALQRIEGKCAIPDFSLAHRSISAIQKDALSKVEDLARESLNG